MTISMPSLVFPAYAGVSPWMLEVGLLTAGLPRLRGGEPCPVSEMGN